jgi:hypothetical protein
MIIHSFYTTLPLQYPPHVIAVGVIELAQLRYPKLRLPPNSYTQRGYPWWRPYYCRRIDVLGKYIIHILSNIYIYTHA